MAPCRSRILIIKPKNAVTKNDCVFTLITVVYGFARSEEEGNAPDTRERNYCVDNACDHGILTAAEPRYEVESEKSDRSPVESSHNYKKERDSIHHFLSSPFGFLR